MLLLLGACQNESSPTAHTGRTEQQEPVSADTSSTDLSLAARFAQIIVNEQGEALRFSNKSPRSRSIIFYSNGSFEADGDVPLKGKWRFQNDRLELYYDQKDQWYPVPLELYEDGSMKLQGELMQALSN